MHTSRAVFIVERPATAGASDVFLCLIGDALKMRIPYRNICMNRRRLYIRNETRTPSRGRAYEIGNSGDFFFFFRRLISNRGMRVISSEGNYSDDL